MKGNGMKRRAMLLGVLGATLLCTTPVMADAEHVIRYWSFLDPASDNPRSVAQTEMISAFQEKNPDVEVQVEVVHWSKMVPMVITAASAGQAPDVALIHSSRIPLAADAGAIIPIDRFTEAMPAADQDDFLVPFSKRTYKGHVYSLPAEHRIEGMLLYRTDLFEQAGIKAPPKTVDELAEVARKLNTPPVWGFVWALSRQDAAANMKMLQTLYWSEGGGFLHPDGTAAINSPAGIRIAQAITDLALKDEVMPARVVGVEEARTMMKGGTAAVLVEGTQVFENLRAGEAVADNLAAVPLPTLTAAEYPPAALVAGQTFAISKDAEEPEVAWRFIEFMTGPEAQLIGAKIGSNLPVRKSVFSDPWFSGEGRHLVAWKDYIVAEGRPFVVTPLSDFMDDSLGLAYEEILTGRKDPKTALDDAAARFNRRARSTN